MCYGCATGEQDIGKAIRQCLSHAVSPNMNEQSLGDGLLDGVPEGESGR